MMVFMPPALLGMRPRSVVIVDPVADPGPGLGAGLEGLEIDAFVLETAPQPLHAPHQKTVE